MGALAVRLGNVRNFLGEISLPTFATGEDEMLHIFATSCIYLAEIS